ncbi:MAG: MATE family efflux transporter [Candidatus Aminicenantes bacterium]|nr:MAG: MATE family efflux transporter [Candidatus Aminicenantes bacterium]
MSTNMDIMWQDREKITGRPIGKALVSLAAPAVLSVFFNFVFEIIDMFWIGKLGAVSTAALGSASFFIWMLRGLGLTVATGAIALVSRRTGEKNEPGLLAAISNAIGSAFLFSLLMLVIFLPIGLNIFRWLNLEPAVAAFSREYSLVFLSGLIFVYLMMTLEYIIRGVGDTRTPMIITGVSFLLNAVLDPIFIFVLGMGLKGAAYATILSQGVGALLMAVVLLKKIPALIQSRSNGVAFSPGKSGEFFRQFHIIIKIGGPVGVSDAGFSFIYLLLTGIICIFGKEPLAAITIAHRLEGILFFICLGFSMAVAPMVGQYLGAGQPENAKKSVYLALKVTSGILLIICVIYFLFAPFLFRVFINDPLIIRDGVIYLRIIAVFEIFLAFEVVLGGAFSGAGETRPLFWVVFPLTALRIPLAYLFAVMLQLKVTAIWAVIAFTMVLKGALLLYIFNKGKWAKKKI